MPEINDARTLDALLDECQTALRYRFRDRDLLVTCLTHASTARTRLASNERLEFLGDAVLGMVVCEMLFQRLPEAEEGELTRIKSIVVSRATCAMMADRVPLEPFVLVGKGLGGHHRIPSSILAGAFESLIAGLYLDGGLDAARSFLAPLVLPEIEQASESLHAQNFKSQLQHVAQKNLGETPVYRLLDERGPDHSKCFHISAVIGGRAFPSAWGPNKKEAEQFAAQNALLELQAADVNSAIADAGDEPVDSAAPATNPDPECGNPAATLPEISAADNASVVETPFGFGIESPC